MPCPDFSSASCSGHFSTRCSYPPSSAPSPASTASITCTASTHPAETTFHPSSANHCSPFSCRCATSAFPSGSHASSSCCTVDFACAAQSASRHAPPMLPPPPSANPCSYCSP